MGDDLKILLVESGVTSPQKDGPPEKFSRFGDVKLVFIKKLISEFSKSCFFKYYKKSKIKRNSFLFVNNLFVKKHC